MRLSRPIVGALLAVLAWLPGHAATTKPVLPWIDDNWTRAVSEAKTRKLPIFVESWAPW